jgi:hypothetical protein
VDCVCERFHQRAFHKAHATGHAKEILGGSANVFGKTSVKIQAVGLALRANIMATRRAIPAATAGNEGVNGYALAGLEFLNAGPKFRNLTAEFVAEHQGRHAPLGSAQKAVKVRTTDPGGSNPHKRHPNSNLRNRKLLEFELARRRIDKGFHVLVFSSQQTGACHKSPQFASGNFERYVLKAAFRGEEKARRLEIFEHRPCSLSNGLRRLDHVAPLIHYTNRKLTFEFHRFPTASACCNRACSIRVTPDRGVQSRTRRLARHIG